MTMTTADRTTVETLLAHADFVRGLSRTLVSDPEVADDAVQQAWLEACERPPADLRSPRGWLATVTRNAVRKIQRGEGRRDGREQAAAQPEGVPSAAAIAEREEARRKLVGAVLALDEPSRSAIVLRYLEELPPREVARRLDVPVETARTRIKRGLETLRGALDAAWGGSRKAWGLALIPLALGGTARAGTGVAAALVAAAAIALAGGAVALGLALGGGGAPAPAGTTPLTVAGGDPAGGDPATDRVPPPLPPLGPAGAGAGAAGAPEAGGTAPAAPAGHAEPAAGGPAAAPPGGGVLRLRSSVADAHVAHRGVVALEAVFENAGDTPVKLYRPPFHSLYAFPTWRLVHTDGRVFAPAARMAQTMVSAGLQGEILELAPGQALRSPFQTADFTLIDGAGGAPAVRKSGPLPAGRYRVTCAHTQADNRLPYLVDAQDRGWGYDRVSKPVAGVWTGRLDAAEFWIAVGPPTEPRMTVTQEGTATAGGACLLRLTVRNPSRADVPLDGPLRVVLYNKGRPACRATIPPDRLSPVAGGPAPRRFVVPAGESLAVRFDLSRVPFTLTRRGTTVGPLGLYECTWGGGAFLDASWATAEPADAPVVEADALTIRVQRAAVAAASGLRCRVTPLGGTRVRVALWNAGREAQRVCARLSWPAELRLTLADPDRPSHTRAAVTGGGVHDLPDFTTERIRADLSWNGDAYERPGPLTAGDFTLLAPGAAVEREIDLARCVYGGLPAGRYRLQVTWRSLTTGRHLGLEAAVVGTLSAPPVDVTAP